MHLPFAVTLCLNTLPLSIQITFKLTVNLVWIVIAELTRLTLFVSLILIYSFSDSFVTSKTSFTVTSRPLSLNYRELYFNIDKNFSLGFGLHWTEWEVRLVDFSLVHFFIFFYTVYSTQITQTKTYIRLNSILFTSLLRLVCMNGRNN